MSEVANTQQQQEETSEQEQKNKKKQEVAKPKQHKPAKNSGSSSSSNGNGTNESSNGDGAQTQRPPAKIPTEADMKRYEGYVGQHWTGKCKWFNVSKGFGFIIPDHEEAKENEDDVFVHQSALQMPGFRSLDEGEEIEFNIQLGKRGLEAENVTGVGGAAIRGHSIRPMGKKKAKEQLIRCYNCGQLGRHKANRCKKLLTSGSDAQPGGAPGEAPQKVCYHCHATDHLLAQCPDYAKAKSEKRAQGGGASRRGAKERRTGGNGGGNRGGNGKKAQHGEQKPQQQPPQQQQPASQQKTE